MIGHFLSKNATIHFHKVGRIIEIITFNNGCLIIITTSKTEVSATDSSRAIKNTDMCTDSCTCYLGESRLDVERGQVRGRHPQVKAHYLLHGADPVGEEASCLSVKLQEIRYL